MAVEGHATIEERPSDDFVHGVVPANILAQSQHFSLGVKKSRGVQAACAAKNLLRRAKLFRKLAENFRIESRARIGAAQAAAAELIDGCFAANAACRSR